jgi:signal transduction histidine kinase
MRARPWLAVAVSYGALIFLLPLFTFLVSWESDRLLIRTKAARQVYQKSDDVIYDIQESINKGALIEPSGFKDHGGAERRISDLQRNTMRDCDTLLALRGATQQVQILALQQALDEYWNSIKQTVNASQTQDGERRLFRELENQPTKVLEVADSIDVLNVSNLNIEEKEIETQQGHVRRFAIVATLILFVCGCIIAGLTTAYVARLDSASQAEKNHVATAQKELRRLTNQLVQVQEDERKTISRELHDELGQILTGLRMELGALSQNEPDERYRERLESVKRLAEDALRSVRNMALLIRPSMLDDLGLESALRWQAKEFMRRCGIVVSVSFEGELESLPEAIRLCLYRAVQEAITNCGKHADATRVSVIVKQNGNRVSASIQDNGKGFDWPRLQSRGLGLIGMTERVRALHGKMNVTSNPGSGTLINLEMPIGPN